MKHKLELEKTYSTGAEKWFCPECGYEFVAQWKPFKRVITQEGDANATHFFRYGDVIINNVAARQEQYNLDLFKEFIDDMEYGDD